MATSVLSRRDLLRVVGLGAAAATIGPSLAACSGSDGSGGGGGGGGGGGADVVEWNGWTGADNVDNLKDFIAKFGQTSPGFQVQNTAYQWDTLFTKLPVAVQAGQAPNVVIMHPTELPQFIDLGILLPLEQPLKDAGISLDGISSESIAAVTIDGQLYGIPGDYHPFSFYYNTAHFKTAGISEAPTTGEELLETARTLAAKVPSSAMVAPLYIPYVNNPTARRFWWGLLHQFGGTFLSEDQTRCVADSEAGVRSLQFLVDLYEQDLATGEGGAQSPETSGKIGMWANGPWMISQYRAAKVPFATAEMPVVGSRKGTWSNAHCFTVIKGTEGDRLTNSLTFIKWFQDNYGIPATTVGVIPISPAAREDPAFTESESFPFMQPFIKALEYSSLEPAITRYGQVFSEQKPTPLSVGLTDAIQRKKTVPEALKDIVEGVNKSLAGS